MTCRWLLAILIPQAPQLLWLESSQLVMQNPSTLEHALLALGMIGCYLLLFGRSRKSGEALAVQNPEQAGRVSRTRTNRRRAA